MTVEETKKDNVTPDPQPQQLYAKIKQMKESDQKIEKLKEQFNLAIEMLEFSYDELSKLSHDDNHGLAIQAASMMTDIAFSQFLRASSNCHAVASGTLDVGDIGFPEFSKSVKFDAN